MTAPTVTAVIVSYNSAADLRESLPLLASAGVETVVVDNASDDDSAEVARELGATVIASPANRGWAVGCNLGAAAASAAVLAFVNPDARATADDLLRLAQRLRPPERAIVSPRFVDPDGRPQAFYFRFPDARSGPFCFFGSAARLDRLLGRRFIGRRTYSFGADLPCEVDQPGAACLLMRADTFRDLGGYDERFFLFFADTDLCLRASQQGLAVAVDWEVDVRHRGGGSVLLVDSIARQHFLHRDYLTYARLHYGPVGRVFTACVYVLLGGVMPALARLVRGRPGEARRNLTLMRAGLTRARSSTPA